MQLPASIITKLSPREIAREVERASPDAITKIFEHLDRKKERLVVKTLSDDGLEKTMRAVGVKRFADILAHMKDTEAVQILRRLPREKRDEILDTLPKREKTVYSFLLRYSKDVAGGWMRTDILRIMPRESVTSMRRKLKEHDGYAKHIIVETDDGIFFGVIPVEIILHAPRNARAEDLAVGAETIDVDSDSEDLARMFTQSNPEIVIVLDEGKVLGVVTPQEAISLLEKEHAEDVAKIFSMRGVEHVWTPIWKAIKNRTPWLVINLFTEFIAASVVNIFDSTIKTMALLAVFMPIVPGDAGNATTQTMAIVVRGLATGELDKTSLRRLFWKEFVLGLINGIIVGLVAFAFTYAWKGNTLASLALALATPLSLVVAGLIGVAIPLLLKKIGQDPASSSTIILTTITDAVGFATFLGIAAILMKMWGV